ncbi:MAG: hypothetical protein ACKODA_01035, partial [Nevskiaceae bacterium]
MNWLRRTRQAFWGMVFAARWRRTRESGVTPPPAFSLLIRGGTVYDGSGALPRVADIGIVRDRIAAFGDLGWMRGRPEVDARGLALAPGFINTLSRATETI